MRHNRLRQLVGQNFGTGQPVKTARNQAGAVEIMIYDVIDPWFGISAASIAQAIKDAGDAPLVIRLNSPGGDVFDGRAIANQIAQHAAPTEVIVDGLAASAASTIAIAANKLTMAAGSFLMIHCAWSFVMDNADGMRAMASLLDKIDGEIAADYARKAGCTPQQAMDWMKAETWFTAEEAQAAGLADAVLASDAKMQAFNLAAYDRTPRALIDRIAALSAAPDTPDFEAMRAQAARRLRLFDHLAA